MRNLHQKYICLQNNIPQQFQHGNDSVDEGNEGKVQSFEVDTTKLTDYDFVFIGVWAFNKVRYFKTDDLM